MWVHRAATKAHWGIMTAVPVITTNYNNLSVFNGNFRNVEVPVKAVG
jgi:hypothetical protein